MDEKVLGLDFRLVEGKVDTWRNERDALPVETPGVSGIAKRQTLSEVSSVINCEALAFVAAQLHAAKCVQRYKCSEIAQALKETLYFLFFLLLNSLYCTF